MKKSFLNAKNFWRFLRYIAIFLWILIFSFSIQLFVQNFTIDQNIKDLKNQQKILSWETYWTKHYYEPYLKSKYAYIIFSHSNWLALDKEIIVKVVSFENNKKNENLDNFKVIYNLSWQSFFWKLIKKLTSNFF